MLIHEWGVFVLVERQLPVPILAMARGANPAGRPPSAPLAERMRPRTLDEIVGQTKALGPGSALRQILNSTALALPSMVLWGPPGVGKTTIAKVLAESSGAKVMQLSGVLDGVKELREAVIEAQRGRDHQGRSSVVIVDEIHRFNRAQQDAFLPHVESGLLTIIGLTTDNVSFRLRGALLSRLRVILLEPLVESELVLLLDRALADVERGLGHLALTIDSDARLALARFGGGDARRVLTGLEWSAAQALAKGQTRISREIVEESFSSQPARYDQAGDEHYDCVSAFIKSMRGSDPDAALYYMLRAIAGGEDPQFITRRMIIFASEDASCDPRALEIALNVDRAVERVGLPEGKIPLAQAAVYLSCCPKSNASYQALKVMEKVVEDFPNLEIPRRLRNSPTELMGELGNGVGYRYPHDYPEAYVAERYLPPEIEGIVAYRPTDRGIDRQIAERLERLRGK